MYIINMCIWCMISHMRTLIWPPWVRVFAAKVVGMYVYTRIRLAQTVDICTHINVCAMHIFDIFGIYQDRLFKQYHLLSMRFWLTLDVSLVILPSVLASACTALPLSISIQVQSSHVFGREFQSYGHIRCVYKGLARTVYKYAYILWFSCPKYRLYTVYTLYIHRLYTSYTPYIHRIYMVLANPLYIRFWPALIFACWSLCSLPADLPLLSCSSLSNFAVLTHRHSHTHTHTHTHTHIHTHRHSHKHFVLLLHACPLHVLHACHTFYTHVIYITRSTRMSHVLHACHIYLYITRSTRMSYISLYHMFYTHVIYITHSTRMSYISHVLHACHIHHTFYTHVNYKQQAEAEGEWEKLQESQGEFCYHSLCHLLLDMCHAILLSFFVSSVAGYVSCNFVIFLCVICCWICVMQFWYLSLCHLLLDMCRVGQNRISAPYMTVCMVISLLKIPYVHRIYL